MKALWQTRADRVICRWSEEREVVQYNPPWMQNVSVDVNKDNLSPSFDFRRHSPFGGGEWYGFSNHLLRTWLKLDDRWVGYE
jgi:hypothetical protein